MIQHFAEVFLLSDSRMEHLASWNLEYGAAVFFFVVILSVSQYYIVCKMIDFSLPYRMPDDATLTTVNQCCSTRKSYQQLRGKSEMIRTNISWANAFFNIKLLKCIYDNEFMVWEAGPRW